VVVTNKEYEGGLVVPYMSGKERHKDRSEHAVRGIIFPDSLDIATGTAYGSSSWRRSSFEIYAMKETMSSQRPAVVVDGSTSVVMLSMEYAWLRSPRNSWAPLASSLVCVPPRLHSPKPQWLSVPFLSALGGRVAF